MSTLLVPYYEHPAVRPAEWAAVLAAAPRLYGVVLNPASGPGTVPDPAFAEVAARLRAADVRVLGYTDTAYGRRPPAEVADDLARHRAWYATDGVFLDQVASGPGDLPYYRGLAHAVRAAGCRSLTLNPGTPPHPGYARVADVLVTFEDPWAAYRTRRPPAPAVAAVQCHLVHGVPAGADCAGLARSLGAGLHCAVPGTGDHPWGTLPHTLEPVR
ncbi:spherulation-specific family 4 protein [Streptomyces sp. bgisy159]|uniref:spherulation-specific family 4 protein n=1 Tax=Streptomyces sp. bgisy159 TaxID=3413795 RepID=UPI003F49BC9F